MTFKEDDAIQSLPVVVPCGRCKGCRYQRSREWAIRCVHEAQQHDDNAFITLTYNDANLPYGGTLIKKDFQDFMKRLRRPLAPRSLQYFHCGEYGERTRRPHYHALLFGHDFHDKAFYKKSVDGSTIFTSPELSRLWDKGFSTTGAVTFESAAYCARYVMKKMTGLYAQTHYSVIEPSTGELVQLVPEYITMSLKPAIGRGWIDEYQDETYPDDFVVVNGKKMKPPKYYDRRYELDAAEACADVKEARAAYAEAHKENSTPERLAVREKVFISRISQLKRNLE